MYLNQKKNHKMLKKTKPRHIKKLEKAPRFRRSTPEQNKLHNHEDNAFYSTKYKNFARLQRTIRKPVKYRHEPDGNVINISKHSFSRAKYTFLNMNLNLISTPNLCNKQKLDFELQNFNCSIKLKNYFKGVEQQKETNREEQMFKSRTKGKWTPSDNHHPIY